MPEFSEDIMLEFSDVVTPKFSKVRFTSLNNMRQDEQIEQHGHQTTVDVEQLEVLDPQEPAEQEEHNGNGHHTTVDVEQLEVLDSQQQDEQEEHNEHQMTAKLEQPHVVDSQRPAEWEEHNEHQMTAKLEQPHVVDSQEAVEPVEHNEHQTTAKLEQPHVLYPRRSLKRKQNNEHQMTAKLEQPHVVDSQRPAEPVEHNEHQTTAKLEQPRVLYPRRFLKRKQNNGHHATPQISPLNETQKLSAPARPFNHVRLTATSVHTAKTKQITVAPATRRPTVKPATVIPRVQDQERIKFYAAWLDKQAEHDRHHDNAQEINDYIQEAAKIVKVGEHEVAIFAPFRPKLSALQTFTTGQVVAFALIGLLWIAGILLLRLQFLAVVVATVTILYFLNLIINFSLATRAFRNPPEEHISDDIVNALKDAEWPEYTILCPLYKEAQVVPQFVKAMSALDYPAEKLHILFLTEVDDAGTRDAIRALSLPPHFKIVVVPDGKPRTKPRACNYGLMLAKGQYVVIYDAEDIPDPLQLKKALLAFANHGTDVVCVQAKLNFYNIRQNLLTRWFTAEYSTWFDLILPGLQLANFSLPLGGTSNHFRTGSLRALGGWDAYNVTEDCDLGLRLKRYRMNTVILDSTTLEEANSQLKNWLRQRSRWIKGYMQTYLVYMRHPLENFRKGHLYDLFSFQVVIGSGVAVMFINPLMWVLLGLYFAFGSSLINIYHIFFPGPTF